ncbi:ThuA domain-containing protein [uncultured Sunxiuqinia sp.]|uniref:ThuA domain-containing protein n=1 Tax=Sunxiuqinia rutila TaxID=1397841 RepID=UPI002625DC0B|nr:ThuA domain-containing protein [uncultured Sunxiuqinia sp.]
MKKLLLLSICICFLFSAQAQGPDAFPEKTLNVLVFSKTSGWKHRSISSGLKMFSDLATTEGWNLTATEDANLFTMDFLVNFDVVVFLNPTLDILTDKQQMAFENFMKTGKGFVGVHASADCEYDWEWYGQLNGAYFLNHPPSQKGTVIFEDHNHPAMKAFEGMNKYTTVDEWYTFKANPRAKVNVLARLDESSIKKSENDKWKMGDHPLIWWQEFEGIRSFYSVFGHTHEAFEDPKIQAHYAGAVNWAGKR